LVEATNEEALDLTVLVLGDEKRVGPIAQALEVAGLDVESARAKHARQSVQVAVPELLVAVGSAVEDGGKQVYANVRNVYGGIPLFLICPRPKAVLADLWKHDSIGVIDPATEATSIAQRVVATMRALEAAECKTVREALARTEPKAAAPKLAPAATAAVPKPVGALPLPGANAKPAAQAPAPPRPLGNVPAPPARLVEVAKQAEAQLIREHEAASTPSVANEATPAVSMEPVSIPAVIVDPSISIAPDPRAQVAAPREDSTPLAWIREHTPNPVDGWQRWRERLAATVLRVLAQAKALDRVRTGLMPRLASARDVVVERTTSNIRWSLAGGVIVPLGVAFGFLLASPTNDGARALAPVEVRGSLAATVPAAAAAVEEPAQARAPEPAPVAEEEPAPAAAPAVKSERTRQIATANKLVANGHRLRKEGRLGLAESAYLSALKALPRYPRAMAGLTRVHLERRAPVEALRWAKKLVERRPRSGRNQLLLGDAHKLMGQKGRARRAWRKAAAYGNRIARQRLKDKSSFSPATP
jgi:hypothetical protein